MVNMLEEAGNNPQEQGVVGCIAVEEDCNHMVNNQNWVADNKTLCCKILEKTGL